MKTGAQPKRLKKELSLFKIYCLATGATLSSGFFLLPGLAAAQAGPAVNLSYLIAAVYLIPAIFCMAELSTAMPRAGGIYYFVDRSMGPLLGTIAGIGTWLALTLKTAFALIGMGAYVSLFFPDLHIIPLAISLAVLFGILNLFGAKKTGGFQIVMVVILLALLGWFFVKGTLNLDLSHFRNYMGSGFESIFATAGLVYISYVGLTKIASFSEEVSNPEKNLPRAMFLALGTVILIYVVGTTIMVGVLHPDALKHSLTPVADAARAVSGKTGAAVLTVAAVLAFFSVSNAGIMSASRYPLAMSRDNLLPRFFRILNKNRIPKISIYVTVGLMIFFITVFDPTRLAKLASAFQLLLFALSCLAVIIMRESGLEAYDPGYRSPFYPWLQFAGVISPIFLIAEMGIYPALFTTGLITFGTAWYFYYARKHITRDGAIFHYFARLGQRRFAGLDRELRGIMKEKGVRKHDPFDVLIARAEVIDLRKRVTFDHVVELVSQKLAKLLPHKAKIFEETFMQGTKVGATPVSHGIALPHLRLPEIKNPELVIVRAHRGVHVKVEGDLKSDSGNEPVHAFFFLVSPEEDPGQHLRLLAQIASQVDDEEFLSHWLEAEDNFALRELLHRHERAISIHIAEDNATSELANKTVRDLKMPEGSLIAIINRNGKIIVPRGRTVLKTGDQLNIIGEPDKIKHLRKQYGL